MFVHLSHQKNGLRRRPTYQIEAEKQIFNLICSEGKDSYVEIVIQKDEVKSNAIGPMVIFSWIATGRDT